MAADWSIALGVLIYLVALIIAIVVYLKNKKFSMVAFIAAVSTYIFAVFYTWDVFSLKKNMVLLILVISTLVMFFLGWYFSKFKITTKNGKKK